MSLTPVDIRHTEFKTSIRGYDKKQVDDFLQTAVETLECLLREKTDLQRKVEALQEEAEQVREMKSAMTEALTLAQKTAEEVRSAAHKQAEMILKEAEQERVRMTADAQRDAEKYRTEVALLEATRDRFESEFRALLDSYSEWLDKRHASGKTTASSQKVVRSEVA